VTSGTTSGSSAGTSNTGGATDPNIINNLDAIILGQATASFGGGRSTAKLLAILGKLNPNGIPTPQQVLAGIPRVPVAGLAYWVDDWHAYRCCPKPHLHQGVDMMAARGTPLIAVADGVTSQKVNDPLWSGLGLALTDRSGTRYFYAHLSAFAPSVYVGKHVRVGEVIGYVGNTGDAAGGPTHLHFEVHPYSGVAAPPKPYVDHWLDVAQAHAIKLVQKKTGKKITNADLDLSYWKSRLLRLAQQEIQAGRLLAARQAIAARGKPKGPDQQSVPYGLPVVGLALIAGALLFIDRRRLARPRREPAGEVAEKMPLESYDYEFAVLAEAEAATIPGTDGPEEEARPPALVEL
jgi:hypothetical protein